MAVHTHHGIRPIVRLVIRIISKVSFIFTILPVGGDDDEAHLTQDVGQVHRAVVQVLHIATRTMSVTVWHMGMRYGASTEKVDGET